VKEFEMQINHKPFQSTAQEARKVIAAESRNVWAPEIDMEAKNASFTVALAEMWRGSGVQPIALRQREKWNPK
jgi:hypothetical protein